MLVVIAGCVPQAITATCDPDDVDCWISHLIFQDAAGNDTNAVLVDTATVAALSTQTATSTSAPVLVSAPAEYVFSFGPVVSGTDILLTDPIDASFSDPNGCSPVLGFALATGAGTRSTHLGCFPGLHDMKKSGTITSSFGFTASVATPANLTLQIVPISSAGCVSIDDPAALVTSATAAANLFVSIPIMIDPPVMSGSGTTGGACPDGELNASTLECDPIGAGGASSTCITAAEYSQATGGLPLPTACAPAGTTGCENSTGTLVMPCCPGLTCEVGAACGDANSAPGGTCH